MNINKSIAISDRGIVRITHLPYTTHYSCAVCGWMPSHWLPKLHGWGKAQKLRALVREHYRIKHTTPEPGGTGRGGENHGKLFARI